MSATEEDLVSARTEIIDVMRRYDLAGIIVISTPEHTKYAFHLTPSWSCARLEGDHLEFKANDLLYPDPEKKARVVKDTISAISGFQTVCAHMAGQLQCALLMLSQKFQIGTVNRLFKGQ